MDLCAFMELCFIIRYYTTVVGHKCLQLQVWANESSWLWLRIAACESAPSGAIRFCISSDQRMSTESIRVSKWQYSPVIRPLHALHTNTDTYWEKILKMWVQYICVNYIAHADHFKDDPGSKVQKRANPALKREPTITLMSVPWLSFSIPFYHLLY